MPLFASKLLSPLQNVCGFGTTGSHVKELPATQGVLLSPARSGELGNPRLTGRTASPWQPFALPGQPPPRTHHPLPKLQEFSPVPADVQLGLPRATDKAFRTLRALAGTKQMVFFLSWSSWLLGHLPSAALGEL